MWHEQLTDEIALEFERLSSVPDFAELANFNVAGSWTRQTRGLRPGSTPEQKRAKRKTLEASRREYKARKAREYYVRKKLA